MKILTYCGVFVLLALISFPITAEAFSWFSHSSDSSELVQNPGQSAPLDQTRNVSPQAVPEPPALLLMGIGIGLFAIYSMIKRFRGQNASREKAL
jgi:PEP-CTERM motif-containing protein